jgi:uncharacterized protein
MKALVWFLLGLLVVWALRSQALRHQKKRDANNNPTRPSTNASKPIEKMVACSYCQVYLPMSEAVRVTDESSERYFCSEEHLRLHTNSTQSQ